MRGRVPSFRYPEQGSRQQENPMGQLTDKTALVAGAGRNNGKAISIAFAREGADLILVAREKKDALAEVVKECEKLGAKVLPVMADVSDHAQVERLVQQGLDRF